MTCDLKVQEHALFEQFDGLTELRRCTISVTEHLPHLPHHPFITQSGMGLVSRQSETGSLWSGPVRPSIRLSMVETLSHLL